MFIEKKTVTAFNSSQVAYPVGKDKDAYCVQSWFVENLETGSIESQHKLVKNSSCAKYNPKRNYRAGTRFREELFTGSYKDCIEKVKEIVEIEGEWVRDEKLNYIHPIYS